MARNQQRVDKVFAAVLLASAIGLLFFAGISLKDKYILNKNAKEAILLMNFNTKIGALVHEMQKERGTNAVYIGSAGAKMKKELQLELRGYGLNEELIKLVLEDGKVEDFKELMIVFTMFYFSNNFAFGNLCFF